MAFALVLAALLLLVLGVALEVGARMFWTLPPAMAEFHNQGLYCEIDGAIGLQPGYRGRFRIGDGHTTAISANALGLRGPEVPPRSAGVPRVLVAGDSVVFGYGVEDDEALPAALQRELATARSGPVVTGNAGIPGFGSALTAQRLASLVPTFDPDLALFAVYLGNDFVDDRTAEHTVSGGMLFSGAWAHLMRQSLRARLATRSRFLLWVETWVLTNHPAWSPMQLLATPAWQADLGGMPEPNRTLAGLFLDVADADRSWSPGPSPVRRGLQILQQSLDAARRALGDRKLVVLVLPTQWHTDQARWTAELQRLGYDPGQFRFGALRERIAALAASLDLPLFDATAVLAAAADRSAQFLDGGHLSPAGNQLVAAALAGFVLPLLPR